MSRIDAGYVAYLTRKNAWLRAQVALLGHQLEELRAVLEELRIEAAVLEARACATVPADGVDGT